MPYSSGAWGYDEEPEFDEQGFWGDEDPDSLSIWKPRDPDPWFSPTLPERNAYRAEMARMAAQLSRENLGGAAQAFGPTGYGAAYAPPGLGWTKWGSYEPRSRVGLSSWGWDHGLKDPFPILSGAIVAPTIRVFTEQREQDYDQSGRRLYDPTQRVRSEMISGRAIVGQIMSGAGERGQAELRRLIESGMSVAQAGPLAERVARQSVRSQVQPFGRADFGERWSYPYGLRQAIAGSANIRFEGDYSLGPKALFGELGKIGRGYFTKATSPSVEMEHPERGSWQAYSLDSLYALGWLPTAGGGFVTGTNKPAKRRQLGVQKLAAPVGADALLRTGRLTGDRMLNTTAVFLDNYPFSEGSGVADPALLTGFRDYRPVTVERPQRAGDDWQVRFTTVGQRGAAGESIFLGEQYIGGKWEPLEQLAGKEGIAQSVFGYRKTRSGYQALIEREHPWESGTAKLMHHGMKALLFQSSEIIEQMQGQVRAAMVAGRLPGDAADPRMVLPMPKDWMQTYKGMFDFLPAETLRGMGVSDEIISAKRWSGVAPEVIDRLHAYAEQRKFTFEERHEAPVSRLGAFTNAGNASNISYFEKNGEQWARFTATHTGYALPIAAGIRMEYPGKKPMYSPEELMQLGQFFPGVAKGLLARGNAASRIWGVAAAATQGITPQGAISHEMLPWVSARLDLEGNLEDEGTSRKLLANLARELKGQGLGRSAIVGPGGVLLPAPADVLGKSIRGLSGQEQSTFVSSYIQAMKLMGTGQDATEALANFSQVLQTFTAGHNVRREALGARLERAAEGTFTSHMAIPDDVVVAGESTLRRLAGINRKDPEAAKKLDAFIQQLEGGENPFYVLGTRRPVSDMFNQLGVPMRVVTERMAQELYDVPIENLGRSYAVSPTVAAIWRGDVDADRALLQAVTRAKFGSLGGFVDQIGATGEVSRLWQPGEVSFHTPKEVRNAASGSLMVRQLNALRSNAPDAYQSYVSKLSGEGQLYLSTGLAGDQSTESLLALSEALHGVDVDWNESKKWSDELRTGITKNNPHNYAWYADPANKTVFTREQMLADFERTAKSKMLMGRGYNRYLRGMTSLARSPEELQAGVTFASGIYQKALDNQPMTGGELMLFSLMESLGPTGAMFDKFGKEEGFVGGGSHMTGGPAGMMAVLSSAIMDVDAPASVRATLFSRDPGIRQAVMGARSSYDIIRAVGKGVGEVAGSKSFLEDPSRAGVLPQLVQALHYSKGSMQDVIANEPDAVTRAAQHAYAAEGRRIRSMIRVLGRGEKNGLPLGAYQNVDAKGKAVAMPGAIEDIRNMAGLSTLGGWQRAMAGRMGLGEAFFAGPEAMADILGIPARRAGGPVDDNEPYLVGEEGPEIFVPKTAGDILKLPQDLQARIRSASDPRAEFERVAAELQARVARSRAPEPGSATVPPVPGGGADDDLFGPLPPWLANTTTTPPAAQAAGAASSIDPSATLPNFANTPRVYGFESRYPMPIMVLQRPSRMSEYGVALEQLLAKNEIDIERMPPNLLSTLLQSAPSGKSMEINARGFPGGGYRMRMKLADLGLSGFGLEWLKETVPTALGSPRDRHTQAQIAEGYAVPGVGKGMVQAIRTFAGLDLGLARASRDTNAIWRGIEAAEKLHGAMGDQFATTPGVDARREGIYAAFEDIEQLSAEDRAVTADALNATFYQQPFDYERVWLRDPALAKAIRTYGQRPTSQDVDLLERDEMRALSNKQRDAMATIVDRAGRIGLNYEDLPESFRGDQAMWIARGNDAFQPMPAKIRNIPAQARSQQAFYQQGYDPVYTGMRAAAFANKEITAGQFHALTDLPLTGEQLDRLPATPSSIPQRLKLLRQSQGDLMTLIGMNEKGAVPDELVKALGAVTDEMQGLTEQMQALEEVEQQRVEQVRQQAEQFIRSPEGQQQMTGVSAYMADVQGRTDAGQMLRQEDVRRLGNISELYRRIGTPGSTAMADNIDEMMGQQELRGLAQMAGQGGGGGGLRGVWGRLFGRGGQGGPEGAPAIENMFTELTLGWTAFRARMAWNLATGAQQGWMQEFLGEDSAAIGAAMAGGSRPGGASPLSSYISSRAAISNMRAQLGEGVAQVYTPLMGAVSGLNMGASIGAGATLLGTPIGAGAVAAMGTQMLGRGLESAALTAAAGPVGLGVAGLTGAVLGISYLTGLGETWAQQPEGSVGRFLGRAVRPSQIVAEQTHLPAWFGTAQTLLSPWVAQPSLLYGLFDPDVDRQLQQEEAAMLPGTLQGDAGRLRDWANQRYHSRANVTDVLNLTGSMLQVTGQRAQTVYDQTSPQFQQLMDTWVDYMAAGANPTELINSQVGAAGAAGVPLGPQTMDWMVRFANLVPGEQRQMYEQAFQNLSPLASATMRPTTFDQASRAVALAQSTGSMQRAANMVMGQQGVGWFTGTFGLEQEGALAKTLGTELTALPIAQQETIQRYGGTVASSASRMGLGASQAATFAQQLAFIAPDDVLRVSNLVVQAESVALESGEGGDKFRNLLWNALGAGMQNESAGMQRWFMAARTGGAGVAPQIMMPHGQRARLFEGQLSLLPENMQDDARVAASILNRAYPTLGYSTGQLTGLTGRLFNEDVSISELSLVEMAKAGRTGVAAAMGVPLGSPNASLIDRIIVGGGSTPFTEAIGVQPGARLNLTEDQAAALPGFLNASMFQYMTGNQIAGIAPNIGQMFSEFWSGDMSLNQFNQAMQVATGSTPWGYSAGLGFGPGSLTDRLGRPYGQYEAWTATAGRQAGASFAPLFDMQMSASYASLGYASAANAAQSRQFERQQAQFYREYGSGAYQPLSAVQAALAGEGASEPGSGLQIGGSTIGFAQQESAIRRQMWQESISAQQQSIQFSRQSLEISRQEFAIAKQEAALSKEQYATQREYKLGEQQAQRGMQLRQFEWSAEDYAIKVERTGISQGWAMEDLQRQRRYAVGRQRVEIERQIQRTQITQGWERDDTNRSRDRELEVQRYQDQRYEAAVAFEQKLHDLQMRRFDLQDQRMALQEQRLALQDAQLAAQEARLNNQTVLQEKLNKLEDERAKADYEQKQAQMLDDAKLEKLRKAAQDAQLAYQAAQLANAETLRDAEQKFAESIQGIKDGGVLDKWIEFFDAIRGGPPGPVPPTPPTEDGASGVPTQPFGEEPPDGRMRLLEMNPTAGLSTSGSPTIVNFVLDGEVIMSAVVKPERLRPIVQEIQRRDSWR